MKSIALFSVFFVLIVGSSCMAVVDVRENCLAPCSTCDLTSQLTLDCDNCWDYLYGGSGKTKWKRQKTGDWPAYTEYRCGDFVHTARPYAPGFVMAYNVTKTGVLKLSADSTVCEDGDCDWAGNEKDCSFTYVIHNQYDAEPITPWVADVTIVKLMAGPAEMLNVGDTISFTGTGTVSASTSTTFSCSISYKVKVFEATGGISYTTGEARSSSFSSTTSHKITQEDVGKKIGGFAEYCRMKRQVRVHTWGCNGEEDHDDAWVYDFISAPLATYRIGVDNDGVIAAQENEELVSGGGMSFLVK